MDRIAKLDVLESLVPGRPMTAFDVARMLSLRGCLEDDDPQDAEERVRRHLADLAREGHVARAGRAADRTTLWVAAPDALRQSQRRRDRRRAA
jgi:hypothetical protein